MESAIRFVLALGSLHRGSPVSAGHPKAKYGPMSLPPKGRRELLSGRVHLPYLCVSRSLESCRFRRSDAICRPILGAPHRHHPLLRPLGSREKGRARLYSSLPERAPRAPGKEVIPELKLPLRREAGGETLVLLGWFLRAEGGARFPAAMNAALRGFSHDCPEDRADDRGDGERPSKARVSRQTGKSGKV